MDADGDCLAARKEKPFCQKCRLDRCLEIGMEARDQCYNFVNNFAENDGEKMATLNRITFIFEDKYFYILFQENRHYFVCRVFVKRGAAVAQR
jgi:hypothetical protein